MIKSIFEFWEHAAPRARRIFRTTEKRRLQLPTARTDGGWIGPRTSIEHGKQLEGYEKIQSANVEVNVVHPLRCPRLDVIEKRAIPASLSFIFVFSNKHHYNFNNKYICEKMSIQYTVVGFEPVTFGT